MEKIGILGGTFNPVHKEHVSLGKSAIEELGLDKLIVMPTYISPHKNSTPESAEDRINMLKLAFSEVEGAEISDYEIVKQGKSYTYQTIEHLKNDNCELYFIVGGDMLSNFKEWRYPERILDKCNLCAFDREDFFVDYEREAKYFQERFNKSFIKLSYKGKAISSTAVRVYNRLSLPLTSLTDKKVEEYIRAKGLYRGEFFEQYLTANLPLKRIKHTADVIVCALKRADELGLEREKVTLACTLHDLAKYLDYTSVKGFSLIEPMPKPVIHAFLGAFIAENLLKVEDKDVINAIKYHTSGRPGMSALEKLVFVADMIEDGRDYEGVDKLREAYYKQDFETCFRMCLAEEVIHLKNKGKDVYHLTMDAFRYYCK